jgi:hypothetical protein
MTICSSCDGEVEAATGHCSRCGYGRPGSGGLDIAEPDDVRLDTAEPDDLGLGGAEPDDEEPDAIEVADASDGAGSADSGDADTGRADAGEATGNKTTFGTGLITPNRLRSPLKRLIWLTIVQIVLVAILMTVQKVHQPLVNSAVLGAAGGTLAVPLIVFILTVVSIAAGYCFGLAGALRIRPLAGIPIAALATWTLADAPVSDLRMGSASIGSHPNAALRWAQLAVLAVYWVWLGGRTVLGRQSQRTKPGARWDLDGQPWYPMIFRGALACVLAYYAVEFVIWIRYAQAGQAATGTGALLEDLGVQSVLVPSFLVLVVLLGSTDLLKWGEIAVQSVVVRAQRERTPWLLMVLTPLVALAMIANVLRLDGVHVLVELAVVGAPAVLVALLVRWVPGYGRWSDDKRSHAVITGAVFTFTYTVILVSLSSAIRSAIGWSAPLDFYFYSLVSIPVALAALTVGVLLLADGSIGRGEQRGRGLLLVIVAVLLILAGLPAFLAAAGLPAVFPSQHFTLLSGLQLVAALATLGWLASLVLRKRLQKSAAQLGSALALLAGLQIVSWILDLLNWLASLGADSDYLAASFFFVLVLFGFVTSGESLTGRQANTPAYPRDGRILLIVAYTLVSNASLLYFGALRVPRAGADSLKYLTDDVVTPTGLAALGSALVIVAFVAGMSRVSRGPAGRTGQAGAVPGRAVPRPTTVRSLSAAQVAVAGIGAVATAAALVILGSALPRLAHANAVLLSTTYTARVPGPGCDARGALWSVTPGEPITARCGPAGLRVEIAPGQGGEGDVKFQPPDGFASPDYRISVKIALSRGFDGCAGIFTRASAVGRYLTAICGDGSVGIDRMSLHGSSQIYLKFIRPQVTYTLTTVTQGSDQSVYVGGVKIGNVVDSSFSRTEYVGLGILNSGRSAETATFSHFSFTPGPAIR